MTVSPTSARAAALPSKDRAQTPEEAAEQFEAVLVRQFVEAMTDGLCESASGSGPQAQVEAQRDALTTALTDELVDSGALRLRDLLLRQWGRPTDAPADAAPSGPLDAAPLPAPSSGDDHFRLLREAADLGNSPRRA